jgi:hypothetical protein
MLCFYQMKSFSSSGSGLGLGPRNGSRSPGRNGPCPCSSSQSVNAACPRVSWHILVLHKPSVAQLHAGFRACIDHEESEEAHADADG